MKRASGGPQAALSQVCRGSGLARLVGAPLR